MTLKEEMRLKFLIWSQSFVIKVVLLNLGDVFGIWTKSAAYWVSILCNQGSTSKLLKIVTHDGTCHIDGLNPL